MADGIEIEELEVGGVKVVEVTDEEYKASGGKRGHRWAVPADDDNVNLHEDRNIFEIPRRESGMYYQYVDGSRLNEFLTRGFVLVDRDEIDDPNHPSLSVNPLLNKDSTHHQIGNSFLVKIPQVLADRMAKLKELRAKEAVAGIQIPRQLGKPQIGENGVQVREREQQTEVVRVRNPEQYPTAKE